MASEIKVDTVSEKTSANGVTIDGLNIKDSKIVTANSVDSDVYVDGSIDTAHLAADAVTGAKIADNAINSEHYTDGSIDTAHIAADQITNAKIADDQIDSEHYVDGSIDTAHIADGQVTTAKLATAVFTGATDIGADIADADLFLMDDGAGGTIRKTAASRLKTYAEGRLVKTGRTVVSGGNPAGINVIGCFSTDFDSYMIVLNRFEATVDSQQLKIRMRDANGARTQSVYKAVNRYFEDDGNQGDNNASSATAQYYFAGDSDDSGDDGGFNGIIYVFDPADANTSTRLLNYGTYMNSDVSDINVTMGACHITTAEAHNGIMFDITSGGLRDGGSATVYGIKSS